MPISIVVLAIGGGIPALANPTSQLYLAQTPQLPPGTNIDQLPGSPLPDTQQEPRITPLPPIEDFLDVPPDRLPETGIPDSEVEFEVREFQLEGNTVLEPAEVETILKDYRNRPLTFADLLEIETKLTRLYAQNGYINSGVVIPSQNVGNDIITIQALEGRVEDINVNVDGRLRESYIRSRLRRGTKTPLNIEQLQEALQLLQLNPLVESLNAELSVGLSRDRWTLDVDVNQAPAFDPVLFVNNHRTPSVGSFQRGLELNHNNVLGYADRFSFVYKNTDGSDDFDVNYTIPFNALNGTVALRYRYITSDIVESPFDQLDIESETDEYEIAIRQPIIVTATANSTQELALGLEFSRQSNKTTLENRPFQLSAGSDLDGETTIYALRFFQDWTRRTRQEVLALRSQFSVGLDVFDATINADDPDGEFFAWRGQAQWLRQLDAEANINLLLRSDIQLSTSELVPLEQFSLGGIESVRGYRQDVLLGDNGVLFSAEVRIPVYRWSQGQNSISLIPFADVGTVWSDSEPTNQEDDTLLSLGLGLQLGISERLRARLDWGIPLIDVEDRDDTLQENGVYFSIEYLPF